MLSAVHSKSLNDSYSIPNSVFRAMSEDNFFKAFPQDYAICKYIPTDEADASTDKPIISPEIGDCITIFGVEKDSHSKITGIVGYHASADTSLDTMTEVLNEYFGHGETTDIFLIGGTANSIQKGGLLDTIHKGLNQALKGKYKIIEEKLNLPGKEYVAASLKIDGTLAFCRHD